MLFYIANFVSQMVIQRLNMDNSWWLQLNRVGFLIDPWLHGTEVDFFSWFNTQWHRTKPLGYTDVPAYDWIIITQKYPDHFHIETLKKLQPKRMLIPASLQKKVSALFPDAQIIVFDKHNKQITIDDITITWFFATRKIDPIYDAILLSHKTESLFIASHGFNFDEAIVLKLPTIKLLITTFNFYKLPFFLGGIVAPGINGLNYLNEKLKPTYIVGTHDEDKHTKGLVSKFAKVIKTNDADFKKYPVLFQKKIELNHYNPLEL